jgi:tryptophan-rich sensory protein
MAAIELNNEDNSNIYWPFGFPRDFLIFCKYFAEAAMLPTWFQRSSSPCLHTPSAPIFASRTPLYAATEIENNFVAIETNQTGEDNVIRTGTANKRFFSFASEPYSSRQLFPATPPKRQKANYTAACIELYPQIKNAIGGIGMSLHIIRALTFGSRSASASYRHDERCSLRACRRMISRIFGMRRHSVIFPHFNSLYLSIPSGTPLAFSIQVTVAASSPQGLAAAFFLLTLCRTLPTATSRPTPALTSCLKQSRRATSTSSLPCSTAGLPLIPS